VLSKAVGTAEAEHWFMLSTISSSGATRLRFRLKAGGVTTTLIASSGDLVAGRWQHVAAVYDGAEMRLFLDGALVGAAAKSGALTAGPAVDVWLGGNPPDPTAKPWSGELDDVRVWNRALAVGELRALPGAGRSEVFHDGFETGDTGRWTLDAP